MREPGSGTRGAMERFFAAHHISLNRGMETDTSEAIKQAVQAGMGLGIMSLHTAELELETKRLKILDVQDFPIIRHWHVVHRRNKRLSSVAQAFREFLLKEAPGLMPAIIEAKYLFVRPVLRLLYDLTDIKRDLSKAIRYSGRHRGFSLQKTNR